MFVMPAFGAEQDSTVTYDAGSVAYTVLIPSAIDFTDGDSVAIDYAKLEESTTLSVSVKSNGDWKLTPENGASNTYGYDMFIGGSTNAAVNDDVVVSVDAGSASASVKDASDDDVTAAVSFALDNGVTIKTAGKFTDTLTFTISIDASEGAVLTTVYADTVDDLKNVLNNADSATIKLMEDVTVTETLTITAGKKFTLDLNGNDLSYAVSNTGASAIINNNGDLTITGTGTISFVAENPDMQAIPSYATNTIANTGTLTIGEGVTVSNGSDGGASYAVDNHGIFTLDGGTLIGERCALRVAKYNQDNVVFTMNSGLVEAATPAWIQLPGSDASVAPKIMVTINGGTFQSTKESSADNNVLYTYSYGNSHANTVITINGGSFIGGTVSIGSGYKGDAPDLTINGGIFEYDVLQWLENDQSSVCYSANYQQNP